jgi:hypothetical protein
MTKAIAAPTSVLALALITVGCGGGGGSSSTSANDKAEFLKKADAICASGNKKLEIADERAFGSQPANPTEIERFVGRKLVPIIQAEVVQIRSLPIPSGDQATVSEMLDAAQSDVEQAKRDPALLAQNKPVFKDANELASGYGLTVCGSTHFF